MKMMVTFKDPDTIDDALNDQQFKISKSLQSDMGLSKAGADAEAAERMVNMNKLVHQFMEYSEYITVEFDDVLGTARVVPK